MRFRRKSSNGPDDGLASDDRGALPPLIVGTEDGTTAIERPVGDPMPTTTTVLSSGLRAPRAEDLVAPAVWDDVDDTDADATGADETSEVGVISASDPTPVNTERADWDVFGASSDPSPTPAPVGRLDARRWSLEDWAAVLIMVALSFIFVDRHVAMYPTMSSPAEVQHLDYAYKASRFELPRPGAALDQVAIDTATCRGIESIAPPAADCDEIDGVENEAVGKYNWEVGARSVPYYFTTGLLARLGESVGLFDNFADAARWTGAIWLSLGWIVVWYTMLLLGVERKRRAAIVSLFIATPLLIMPATFVGSAASLFFIGALVLLATVKYATGAWSWWSTGLVFLVGYLFEPTSAPFEIVYLLFLATLALREPTKRARKLLFPVLSIGVLAALWGGVGEWISHQLWPVIPRPETDGGASDPGRVELADAVSSGLTPINRALYPFFTRPGSRLLVDLSSWLVSVLIGSVALFGRSAGRVTLLARWVLLGLVVLGPLVMWQLGHSYGLVVPVPAYLVLPLVAALVVIGGTSLVTRWATILTAAVGVALIAYEIRFLFFV